MKKSRTLNTKLSLITKHWHRHWSSHLRTTPEINKFNLIIATKCGSHVAGFLDIPRNCKELPSSEKQKLLFFVYLLMGVAGPQNLTAELH